MTRAITFPGQGSQAVGMGRALADASAVAREVFEEVDEVLGQKLTRLMWEGPEDELTLTENAQPALMAVSVAAARVLEKEGGIRLADTFAFAAGHSLGEYSALCAVGTLSLADTARLLKTRGQAMQKAVPAGVGAMAALLGLELEAAIEIAQEASKGPDSLCAAANDNAPGQIVISGHKEAVERACELAKTRGAKRAMLLPVSAPFHCPLMQPAAEVMADALGKTDFAVPAIPVVTNVAASAVEEPAQLREMLVAQVTGMVRWRESVAWMAGEGADTFVELGSGKVLTGLAKRIARDASSVSAGTPDEIEALVKLL
ncbi:MAG: ACP S-malonyltransferase [Alphaproteobacteria bacterium]|nr:ACP S-malonyltransferase [Alphaproteobacteria bacterium]MDX5368395.1 ACP S-malonyltransferase [Alphaproteobacteria bacterium]MDX5463190.1 ACP S-malonyltransferase [Alphaproteobacteria bacterium]